MSGVNQERLSTANEGKNRSEPVPSTKVPDIQPMAKEVSELSKSYVFDLYGVMFDSIKMDLIDRVFGLGIDNREYLRTDWSEVEILANEADQMHELVREYFERALFTSIEQTFIASRLSKSSEEDVIKAARLIKYVPGRKDQRKLKQYFCYLVLPGITINGGILSQKLQEVKLELCPSLWERVKRLFTPKN